MKQWLERFFLPEVMLFHGKDESPSLSAMFKRTFLIMLFFGIITGSTFLQFSLHASLILFGPVIYLSYRCFATGSEHIGQFRTTPINPRDYALSRVFWFVVMGAVSACFYALTLQGQQSDHALRLILGGVVSPAHIFRLSLIHFALMMLAFSLGALLKLYLSMGGIWAVNVLWILGTGIFVANDPTAQVLGSLAGGFFSGPKSMIAVLILLCLSALCHLGSYWSVKRLEEKPAVSRALKWLHFAVTVSIVVLVAVLIWLGNRYNNPVDLELPVPEQYSAALEYEKAGDLYSAAISFYACGDYGDARERCWAMWEQLIPRSTIAVTWSQVIALTNDGGVLVSSPADPNPGWDIYSITPDFSAADIQDPERLISVHGGGNFAVGLYDDGTVALWGDLDGERDAEIAKWTDIVGLYTNCMVVIGLKADGTAVACGNPFYGMEEDLTQINNITDIGVGAMHVVALRPDGTVVAGGVGDDGRRSVTFWQNVIDVSAGSIHTVALHTDGTVSAVGFNGWGQCETKDWTNMVAVYGNRYCTAGLRADGTVAATGGLSALSDYVDQEEVSTWTDIVALSLCERFLVGLRTDGTLVATGDTELIQEALDDWENIRLPR